jgi:pimeloyl-ACP methyl ester carboxylesterase
VTLRRTAHRPLTRKRFAAAMRIPAAGRQVAPGSISEKIRVPVNGTGQGMIIKSRDRTNPVLLFVHGGPGLSGYFLEDDHPTGLEQDFTVCWWDQRGAGLSYGRGLGPESMTTTQFIDDTIEVTRYLRRRFGVDKIYLMGHSWGSFIGIQAAAKAPDFYHAYIGVGQVSNQDASERESYDYLLHEYRRRGDTRMVAALEAAPVGPSGPLPAAYDAIRDEAMHRLGVGTTRDMRSVVRGIVLPSLRCREYTLPEKIGLWLGRAFTRRTGLRDDLMSTDLTTTVTSVNVPVYFLSGRFDRTVSPSMAQAYLRALEAPVKGFYTFENSAHSPVHEEPALARRILAQDVRTGGISLRDPL